MDILHHCMVWQEMVIGVYGVSYWLGGDSLTVPWLISALSLLGCFDRLIINKFIWWIPFTQILIMANKTEKIKWI